MLQKIIFIATFAFITLPTIAQTASVSGKIISEGKPVEYANVGLTGSSFGSAKDSTGKFKIKNILSGTYTIQASSIGFNKMEKLIIVKDGDNLTVNFDLTNYQNTLCLW